VYRTHEGVGLGVLRDNPEEDGDVAMLVAELVTTATSSGVT
jgi:hypothetical protein